MSYKLVIVGGQGVGKTSLLDRKNKGNFNKNLESTNSVNAVNVKLRLQARDTNVELETYDLPGSEMFRQLNNMYLRDTNAALIVYDVSDKESLEHADQWMEILKEQAPSETVFSLCGNKMDKN